MFWVSGCQARQAGREEGRQTDRLVVREAGTQTDKQEAIKEIRRQSVEKDDY